MVTPMENLSGVAKFNQVNHTLINYLQAQSLKVELSNFTYSRSFFANNLQNLKIVLDVFESNNQIQTEPLARIREIVRRGITALYNRA